MPVTIRTPDGEMSYQGLDEVRQALTTGLVDPTDQIRLSETEPWRPVSEVAGSRPRWRWKEHFHWYILAVVLVGMHLTGFGLIWLLVAVGAHALWRNTMRRGPRGGLRWW
ncbi:hypothetical protein [Pyxidicoccus caerfyrddinensis]|jgi:hypothetical protein|uniref:hypothetical protein n=1 Tax=Pyxidicoccus caerfyrddinensis TaxID=2709663 RepID=UPI0013D95030|nr:hypothetical protein [Pyxidicoccus caerfyrddinensis]